jgi:hypothetical protein
VKRLVAFAALFGAGLLVAGALTATGVADITTTETLPVTTTVEQTTTAPGATVVTTVEQTTTERKLVPTTTSSGSESSTATWVWIVLALLAAAVVGLLVALLTRRGGISAEERQRRLDAAVGTWAAQGWAIVNQSAGSATMSRGSDVMVVSVDDKGQVDARSVARPGGAS